MNKQKWSEKPVTWGGYLKLCGICCIISMLFGWMWYIVCFEQTWCQKAKEKLRSWSAD